MIDGDAVRGSEDDVRRLAADAAEGDQRIHVPRHLAALRRDCRRDALQCLRLLAEESGSTEIMLSSSAAGAAAIAAGVG